MPGLLREVAEVAGVAAALRLARACGGRPKYIPHKLTPGHELIEAAGEKAATYLSDTYGGETLIIPLGPAAHASTKRRMIRARLATGLSSQRIAGELNCHIRTVERERGRLRQHGDERQLNLLD